MLLAKRVVETMQSKTQEKSVSEIECGFSVRLSECDCRRSSHFSYTNQLPRREISTPIVSVVTIVITVVTTSCKFKICDDYCHHVSRQYYRFPHLVVVNGETAKP